MAPIELDRLRLRRRKSRDERPLPTRIPRGQLFVRGPLPLPWFEVAARLPGKSLHAGLALWFAAGLARSRSIPLSNVSGHRFGLDRNAKYRALRWLEQAGLVAVDRHLGRAPIVTILDVVTSEID